MEFDTDNHIIYTETQGVNRRPYKVSRMNLETLESQTIFIDDNPTHFIDLSVSKDRKFF
jgi:protease II